MEDERRHSVRIVTVSDQELQLHLEEAHDTLKHLNAEVQGQAEEIRSLREKVEKLYEVQMLSETHFAYIRSFEGKLKALKRDLKQELQSARIETVDPNAHQRPGWDGSSIIFASLPGPDVLVRPQAMPVTQFMTTAGGILLGSIIMFILLAFF